MDARVFWSVIENYNIHTWPFQIALLSFVFLSVLLSYNFKKGYFVKLSLGIVNLFIGIVFFGFYGTEPVQKFFALPLFISIGILFIYESIHNKNDEFHRPNRAQILLLFLFVFYPGVSLLLGSSFPQLVLFIMPCPVATLSIVLYTMFKSKNIFLLLLLCIWGLTGIKSIIFHVYEDFILLIAGFYCVIEIIQLIRQKRSKGKTNVHLTIA